MYSQHYRPHRAAPLHPFPAGGKGTEGLPPQSSQSHSVPISPAVKAGDDRTRVWCHDILDSTTLEVGFDQTCLDGLTAELLYTPTNAFAQSCWDILFPEQDPEQVPKTPNSGPPSYRTLPDFYISPGASTSQTTIRAQEQEREEDLDSLIDSESGGCFWDDSDDDIEEDMYEVESQDVKSFVSFDDDESEAASFISHIDAIKNHPIIDADFAVKDSLFLNDLSKVDWKPALMCWEDSLPISVVFREMPVNSKPPKLSKMAALRAKIPILPFRSAALVHNSW